MSEIKLRPCPFCGSDVRLVSTEESEDGTVCCLNTTDELNTAYSYIHCYGCDMDYFPDSDIAREVVEAWNRRAGNE